ESRDPRRAQPQGSARSLRRPPRTGGSAGLRHADQPVDRSRLVDHGRAQGLLRRHAPQAAVTRRREGLRPAREADGADDDLHLPGAVCRDPAAGLRAAAYGRLLLSEGRARGGSAVSYSKKERILKGLPLPSPNSPFGALLKAM